MTFEAHILGMLFWIAMGNLAGKFILARYVKHYMICGSIVGIIAGLSGSLTTYLMRWAMS